MLSGVEAISEGNLNMIRITDPSKRELKKNSEDDIMNHFEDTDCTLEDGRYKVHMPWIDGHPALPSNFSSARRRLDRLMEKLKTNGYHDDYVKVFS